MNYYASFSYYIATFEKKFLKKDLIIFGLYKK
jgi:hypothetical protein